ncbi:dTDP-4-dehydrorhamnose 3,5-epimerase-like enzyme [Neobacillus niacini]|nr:dTDP-4-dehydrorhamnose 3,5-epimerase-like enzyme [Neobacillus niacini]
MGETDVYYMGEENPILLYIPKGGAYGYRVLGNKPATIIYFTTESYNPTFQMKSELVGMIL